MKIFLFSDKFENNHSTKTKALDLNFKPKSRKNNIRSEFLYSKKSERSDFNNDDSSIQLSNANKHINLLLSNCLESIRAEEKEENAQNSFYKDININNLLKNKEKSQSLKNILKENLKAKPHLSKSLNSSSISNLMKTSFGINLINKKNKNNEKEKQISFNSIKKKFRKSISLQNSNIKAKSYLISSLNSKRSSLFSPKRNNIKKKQEYYFIIPKKNEKKNEFDLNKEKMLSKLEGKKYFSCLKVQRIKKKEKEYPNIFYSNFNTSPKSLKKPIKKSKKSLNSIKKLKKSKTSVNSLNYLSKNDKEKYLNEQQPCKMIKFSSYLSPLKNINNYSELNEEDIKNSLTHKNSIRITPGKTKTIIIPRKSLNNLLNKSSKNNINSSKLKIWDNEQLKVLSIKDIENNIKKTITQYDVDQLKKELYDFENNEFTEIINNLPKNNNDNNENKNNKDNYKINTKIIKNLNENKILSTSNNNEDDYLNKKTDEEIDGKIISQNKYRKLFLIKKVYDSLDDEENEDEKDIKSFIITPQTYKAYILDLFILISSFIQLFYLPFYLAYEQLKCKNDYISLKAFLFYASDLIYIIDLIVGFFRAYYNFEEILIKNNLNICINYLTGWFFIDLIEAIPFYTIINFSREKCNDHILYFHIIYSGINSLHYSLLVFKILKIFKVLNENSVLIKIIHYLNRNDFFYNWKGVFFTLLVSLSSLHFCSCFFIFLGKNTYPGWIMRCNLQSNSFYDIYISAVYYLMTTLTTVGYGDIVGSGQCERLYQIILLIFGTCAYSYIVTFISNYIKKKNEKYIDFESKIKILEEIKGKHPLLDNELYERILRYLKYNKSEYKYKVENILDSLPSSLQNNLIVEMYKPIIRNFHFFKYFENSDFFVKIVTSLKPILSMKDDILIQEGDFIEDIIFIKKGVLSLEILINLDCPKESVEGHLNIIDFKNENIVSKQETKKTGKESICNNSVSMISQNANMNNSKMISNFITINEKKINNNKKSIRIIELRKNEHFGDVLMILNERSPLIVKVKSKKAELFFLQKTDATEISNEYPNIWKRILNKSLHNMKQIKNLIQKKIMIFCELNGICLNPELKKKYLEENEINKSNDSVSIDKKLLNKNIRSKKNKIYPKKKIESIIYEEKDNFDSMSNTYVLSDKNMKKESKISNSSKPFSSKELKNSFNSSENTYLSNFSLKINKKNFKESLSNINETNKNKYNLIDKKSKKSKTNETKASKNEENQGKEASSKNNSVCNLNNMITIMDEKMKLSKGQINNFNINIFTPKTIQIPINKINQNNKSILDSDDKDKKNIHYEDDKNSGQINKELYFNEDFKINILNPDIKMNNYDQNNDIIYPNLKRLLENEINKNNQNYDFNSNIKKLLDNNKNIENIKNVEKINLNKKNTEKHNININKIKKFLNLDYTKTFSFTIFSIYENINKLSKYTYQKNSILRQKTKTFILNNCLSRQKSLEYSIDSRKKNIETSYSPPTKINSPIHKNMHSYDMPINRNKVKNKRFSSRDIRNFMSPIKRIKTNDINSLKKRRSSNALKNRINKTIFSHSNISQDENFSYKKKIKKSILSNTISEGEDDKEKNFFKRGKTFRKNIKIKDKDKELSQIERKLNLEERISHNIEKNKQNLNNPEEYFSGFFKNILQRKNTRKNIKTCKKESKMQTLNKKDINSKKK